MMFVLRISGFSLLLRGKEEKYLPSIFFTLGARGAGHSTRFPSSSMIYHMSFPFRMMYPSVKYG